MEIYKFDKGEMMTRSGSDYEYDITPLLYAEGVEVTALYNIYMEGVRFQVKNGTDIKFVYRIEETGCYQRGAYRPKMDAFVKAARAVGA